MGTKRVAVAALTIAVFFAAPFSSWAQNRRAQRSGWDVQQQLHTIEITPYGGYTWTGSVDVRIEDEFGKLDIAGSPSWGVEIDVNVKSGGQFTLLYQRQDSELTFHRNSSPIKETLGDISIDYFQIGGIGGVQRGKMMPFGIFTLGATRLAPDYRLASDIWKFSLIFGFGLKFYLTDHLGVRAQARIPWVVIDGGGAVACGGGGCYVSLGGSGVVQPDIGVGIMFLF